jgi:hypothetical protein
VLGRSFPVIYRLAAAKDIKRLAELIWEHKDEDSSLDPCEKAEFVDVCSEHIKHRL